MDMNSTTSVLSPPKDRASIHFSHTGILDLSEPYDLYVIEGADGLGKTTLAHAIVDSLNKDYGDVAKCVRFPDSPSIRKAVKSELSFFEREKAQDDALNEIISYNFTCDKPTIYIIDRFFLSNIVYRHLTDTYIPSSRNLIGVPVPNVTYLLSRTGGGVVEGVEGDYLDKLAVKESSRLNKLFMAYSVTYSEYSDYLGQVSRFAINDDVEALDYLYTIVKDIENKSSTLLSLVGNVTSYTD